MSEKQAKVTTEVHHVGEPIIFEGYVDDFEHGIAQIQFSLDNGVTWTGYSTEDSRDDVGLTWNFEYTPQRAGCYLLKVRALSKTGEASSLVSGFAFEVLP
ncbi:hypothetical protein [Adlercreutzia agrestimuris]|uniref:hypothetical protein n=1 Tax=Adlercreutzia agrestimuris TaxID=2941324 RepID=UPI0020408862|nr:hypothetical protein [Adlercreutzia agrestimuris]